MTTLLKLITAAAILAMSLIGCNTETSLQQYLVAKQDDDVFVKVDLPSSLLDTEENALNPEQKEILQSVKKVNVVAYPIKKGNMSEYQVEKDKLTSILANEDYKLLTKMRSQDMDITLKYTGDEDAIDEVIVFASSDEKGFAVFRLLGNNMRPEKIMNLIGTLDGSNAKMSQLSGIAEMFDL